MADQQGVGFDGAGEIVKVGKDHNEDLIGKKVAVNQVVYVPGYEGSWRQYVITPKENLMFYPDDADYDKICKFLHYQTLY